MADTLFGGAGFDGAGSGDTRGARDRDAALVRAYEAAGRTLDDLPYTPEFDQLMGALGEPWAGASPREVFHRLHTLRKAARLPRIGRAASAPPLVQPEEERIIEGLVTEAVGTLGQRDQLPFTPAFDRLVQRFNTLANRNLLPHDVWRLVAKLAK